MRHHLVGGLLFAMLIGAGLVVLPAAAQTYKWTDANGKVHYSDQPPPASAKEQSTVKLRNPPAATPPASPATDKDAPEAKAKTYIEQEADFRKRQVETAEREAAEKKKAVDAAEKKQNCEQARAQLKNLQSGGRITRSNTNGEREYLNDAQIAQEIERGKKSVDGWCK
jgi:Domain of unknown function (DUF4124)